MLPCCLSYLHQTSGWRIYTIGIIFIWWACQGQIYFCNELCWLSWSMGCGESWPQFAKSLRSPLKDATDRSGCQWQDTTDATVSAATAGDGRSTQLSRTTLIRDVWCTWRRFHRDRRLRHRRNHHRPVILSCGLLTSGDREYPPLPRHQLTAIAFSL